MAVSQLNEPASAPTTPPPAPVTQEPTSQASKVRRPIRAAMPIWIQELPIWGLPPSSADYDLVTDAQLQAVLDEVHISDPQVRARLDEDLKLLRSDLLDLFRQNDREAVLQQYHYRRSQFFYILLAFAATVLGSLQAVVLNGQPELVPVLAFLETAIALLAAYVATVNNRNPFDRWLKFRRRGEELRREYFRYLMNLPPYNQLSGYEREVKLSQRAASINRGEFPEEDA